MSSTNKTPPVGSGSSRPLNRQIAPTLRFTPVVTPRRADGLIQRAKGPSAPSVFRPAAKPVSTPAAASGVLPLGTDSPLSGQMAIQRSRGISGGKGGLGYTSSGSFYSQEEQEQALRDV